jgi:hypothetical protein
MLSAGTACRTVNLVERWAPGRTVETEILMVWLTKLPNIHVRLSPLSQSPLRKSSRVREGVVLDTSPRLAWCRRSSIEQVDANVHFPAEMMPLSMNSTKSTVHSIVCRGAWKKPGVLLKIVC